MPRIVIGAIRGAHGLKGELKVLLFVEDTDIFKRLKSCTLSGAGERKVLSAKPYKEGWLILLEGVDSPEAAAALRGEELSIDRKNLPPAGDDEIYWRDIAGADVFDEEGVRVGKLVDYLETGAHDVFLIEGDDGGEYLVSNNPAHVRKITPDRVTVERIGLVRQN